MRKIPLIVLVLATLSSCNDATEVREPHSGSKEFAIGANEDTTIKVSDNAFYRLLPVDSFDSKIIWGNHNFTDTSLNAFPSLFGTLYLEGANDSIIVLRRSCGGLCVENIVLPLNATSTERVIDDVKYIDVAAQLVVYASGSDGPTQKVYANLEHLLTQKKQKIILDHACTDRPWDQCDYSCTIHNDQITINWSSEDGKQKSKTVPITIK